MDLTGNLHLLSACESCDIEKIVRKISNILLVAEVRAFIYLGLRMPEHNVSKTELPLILTNGSPAWAAAYQRENRHLKDSAVKRAYSRRLPFSMTLRELEYLSLAFMSANPSMERPTSGIVVPIHGPNCEFALFGVLGQWNDIDSSQKITEISDIHMLAQRVHVTVIRCILKKRQTDAIALTVREKECLLLTARGKTAWEISKIMGRSRGTVNFHLQNAMHKLDAVNKTQATAIAIKSDLLGA